MTDSEYNWDIDSRYNSYCAYTEKGKLLKAMKKEDMVSKTKEVKEKPHLNIGGIGHAGHGKTSLMNALALIINKTFKGKKNPPPTVNISSQQFETNKLSLTYFDCPGDIRYTKNMFIGASQLDAAILVIDASNGPMLQTREHIILARMAGIKSIIVFLNKTDLIMDAELCDLVEMETRDILTQYEFNGDTVSVIPGSALQTLRGQQDVALKKLVNIIDKLDVPERDQQKDAFEMQISKIIPKERGLIVLGTVRTGVLREDDEVFILGKYTQKSNCKFIETFCKRVPEAKCGDNIGIFFENLSSGDVERGQIITKNKKIEVYSKFEAETYILSKDEGGRRTPFKNNYIPQFYFGAFDSPGKVQLISKKKNPVAEPGENITMKVELNKAFPLMEKMRVAIRDGQRTIGAGKISKVL